MRPQLLLPTAAFPWRFSLPPCRSCIRVALLPIVSDSRPSAVANRGLLLFLVQANKVFFLFPVFTGAVPLAGRPVRAWRPWPGSAGEGAPGGRARGVGRDGSPPPGRPCSVGAPPCLSRCSPTCLLGPLRVPAALPLAAFPRSPNDHLTDSLVSVSQASAPLHFSFPSGGAEQAEQGGPGGSCWTDRRTLAGSCSVVPWLPTCPAWLYVV